MYIAICDDDSKITSRLKTDIGTILASLKDEVVVSVFVNGTELIDIIKKEKIHYDILLLDIDMPNISGLEVAKMLRETNEDIFARNVYEKSYDEFKSFSI